MNSIFLLLISVVFFASASVVGRVEAAENDPSTFGQNSPQYTGTRLIQASLNIFGGTAYCGSTLEVYPGYTGYLTMYLQRKSSGSWINVTSWSGSTASLIAVSLAESYSNLISGTTYRVQAIGRVYQNGTFVEEVSATSPERTRKVKNH
jgi:hypothetical protein